MREKAKNEKEKRWRQDSCSYINSASAKQKISEREEITKINRLAKIDDGENTKKQSYLLRRVSIIFTPSITTYLQNRQIFPSGNKFANNEGRKGYAGNWKGYTGNWRIRRPFFRPGGPTSTA
jgi:hypothetical protein